AASTSAIIKIQQIIKCQVIKFDSFPGRTVIVMRPNLAIIILALSIDLILFPNNCVAKFICRPCKNEMECNMPPPVMCEYGEVRNACKRRECAKGPGDRCGGPMNILGQCAENLMCRSDELCHGWFMDTLENYE
ncbi:unnamed protein product, partial [Phaedon cochleariae]